MIKIIISVLLLVLLAVVTSSQIEDETELPKETSFLPTSNEYGEIRYGVDYDDVPIGDNKRQRTIYMGVRNVPYQEKMYRIEKAPSLKEFTKPIFNKTDALISSQLDFEIIDYNYTSETIRINSKIGKVAIQIPYKIKLDNGSFIEKEIIDLSSNDNIYTINVDNIFDGIFHLGEASETHHYNYSLNGTENQAYFKVSGTDTPLNIGHADYSEYGTITYPKINKDDGTKNLWEGGPFVWVNLWYNFTIDEAVDGITDIQVRWNGYDTLTDGGDFELDIWNCTSQSWEVINKTAVAGAADKDYGTTFTSSETDLSEFFCNASDNLHLGISGGKGTLTVREDFVEVVITYTIPSLQGNVIDSDSIPIAGASVFVLLNNTSEPVVYNTTTDGSGEWIISPVELGVYTVCAYKPTNSSLRGDCTPFVEVS